MRSDRARAAGDRGMVTAELAASLPVLVLVLAVALSAVSVGGARVRVQDAAREAARAAARGDDEVAHRLAEQYAPGARLTITATGSQVTVVAVLRAHVLAGWLPAVTIRERAAAAREAEQSATRPDVAGEASAVGSAAGHGSGVPP